MAESLGADALLLLTDVPAVQLDYGTPNARPIDRMSAAEIERLKFPSGSMGPKVAAACRFVHGTDNVAAIGRLDDAVQLLAGTAGTTIYDGSAESCNERRFIMTLETSARRSLKSVREGSSSGSTVLLPPSTLSSGLAGRPI